MSKIQRAKRTRKHLNLDKKYPRVSVFRSNRYISVQVIDDVKNTTVASMSEKKIEGDKVTKSEKARKLGVLLAKEAIKHKIKKVVFDRGSYAYHGRVKQVAEGLREGGLEF